MTMMTLLVALAREAIPLVFIGAAAPNSAATIALASTLLILGASFFVADGIQTIAAGALRGLNDTRMPMLFAVVSFWIIGFASAYTLAFAAGQGAIGVWVGLSVGLTCYALLLVWRFNRLSARYYLPAMTAA